MGIRSQVGIALKSNIADEIIEKHPWIKEADEHFESKEGKLFVFDSIKWYVENDTDINKLHSDLDNNYKSDDFLIVEACSEFPDIGANVGNWVDNPWSLRMVVSVFLNYEERSSEKVK